jgi:hypothetical protein
MPTSLNILASSAIEDSTVDMQPSRFRAPCCFAKVRFVHVPIAPHPGPLAIKPEPSPYSPTEQSQSQYRYSAEPVSLSSHRSHRARPLIPNKCEECVTARQKVFGNGALLTQCTWSTNSDSCDRCRRLEKRCHLRKPTKDDLADGHSDTAMSQSEIYPLSDSAAAALALTELSVAGEERKSPVKAPEQPVNPYQIGGRPSMAAIEPSSPLFKERTRLPSINYPNSPMEVKNLPSHKRKVSRK